MSQVAVGESKASTTGIVPPGQALWNQREPLARSLERFRVLSATVDRPTALARYQWAQLAAFALELRPDVIVELGRERGNSTCCFLEVANRLGGATACRVVSLCLSDDWFEFTLPRIQNLVPPEWFAPGEIRRANILDYDFAAALADRKRCLVFWDAHGFAVAECVLGKLLPLLEGKAHVVVMHDMSDLRYEAPAADYGEMGLWKGANAAEPSFWLGSIFSRVAQAISVVDFCSRNRLPLHSAAESQQAEFGADPIRAAALRQQLGEDFFSLQSHWCWFSVNEAPGPLTYPRFTIGADAAGLEIAQQRSATAQQAAEELESKLAALRAALDNAQAPLAESLAATLGSLKQTLALHQQELAVLCYEKREAERELRRVLGSAGWRVLNAWRGLRNALAPDGTRRRKAYDALLNNLRGKN